MNSSGDETPSSAGSDPSLREPGESTVVAADARRVLEGGGAAPEDDGAADEIELVVGIVRGVGAPAAEATEQLRNSLANHGYDVRPIRVSKLLEDGLVDQDEWRHGMAPDERLQTLINEGNRLCEQAGAKDELAKRVITAIKDERKSITPYPVGPLSADQHEQDQVRREGSRRAYIVDCLKRPEEVALLRWVYGDHFVLVGFQASDDTKREALIEKFAPSHSGAEDVAQLARDLIEQDKDDGLDFGQNVLGTLYMSDVFIGLDGDTDALAQVRRFVAVMFGDPRVAPPTAAEYAMQLATQTSAMSPELGLRVGAAIMSAEGDILATGSNHHPTEINPPAFDAGALDVRRLARDTLQRLADGRDKNGQPLLSPGAVEHLQADGEGFVQELLRGPLKDSQLRGVTEYQRPIHAEMNAVISATRQQVNLVDATLYVTAYPCHHCAKHLIALGLRVVYLEPYAKSRTVEMYGDVGARFTPFVGVAPRRYASWFLYGRSNDRKDKQGVGINWTEQNKRTAVPLVTTQIKTDVKVGLEDWALSTRPKVGSEVGMLVEIAESSRPDDGKRREQGS